jgi:hypothetical protein
MYQATYEPKARVSKKVRKRRVEDPIGWLIRPASFVRMAEVEKLQRAFKKVINFFFTDFVRGEQFLQVEVREAAVGHTGRQKRAQVAGVNRAHAADFLENDAMQGICKDAGIQQLADLQTRSALDQHGAEKTQGVSLQVNCGIFFFSKHLHALNYTVPGLISRQGEDGSRKNWNLRASPARRSRAVYNR